MKIAAKVAVLLATLPDATLSLVMKGQVEGEGIVSVACENSCSSGMRYFTPWSVKCGWVKCAACDSCVAVAERQKLKDRTEAERKLKKLTGKTPKEIEVTLASLWKADPGQSPSALLENVTGFGPSDLALKMKMPLADVIALVRGKEGPLKTMPTVPAQTQAELISVHPQASLDSGALLHTNVNPADLSMATALRLLIRGAKGENGFENLTLGTDPADMRLAMALGVVFGELGVSADKAMTNEKYNGIFNNVGSGHDFYSLPYSKRNRHRRHVPKSKRLAEAKSNAISDTPLPEHVDVATTKVAVDKAAVSDKGAQEETKQAEQSFKVKSEVVQQSVEKEQIEKEQTVEKMEPEAIEKKEPEANETKETDNAEDDLASLLTEPAELAAPEPTVAPIVEAVIEEGPPLTAEEEAERAMSRLAEDKIDQKLPDPPSSINRTEGEATLFIGVNSAPRNIKRRMDIRQTWMQDPLLKTGVVRVGFLIGAAQHRQDSSTEDVEEELAREQAENNDIIRLPMTESYNMLTNKTLTYFRWVAKNGPKARFVMKLDDDSYPHFATLLKVLEKYWDKDSYMGYFHHCAVVQRKGKNAESVKEFGASVFPTYASGSGYVLSRTLVDKLAKRTDLPVLHNEDAAVGVWVDMQHKTEKNVVYHPLATTVYGCDPIDRISMNLKRGEMACMWEKQKRGLENICCSVEGKQEETEAVSDGDGPSLVSYDTRPDEEKMEETEESVREILSPSALLQVKDGHEVDSLAVSRIHRLASIAKDADESCHDDDFPMALLSVKSEIKSVMRTAGLDTTKKNGLLQFAHILRRSLPSD